MKARGYREVAKKLGVKYLFGKYGWSFRREVVLTGIKRPLLPKLKITRLDGWTFDPHEIIEAIANDPDMSIKYKPKGD